MKKLQWRNGNVKVFNWIFAIFCILCLPVFGFHAGSVFMCLLGIVSLPVKPVKKIWNMLPKSKILRPVIIGSLFVIFCYMIPTDSNQSDIVAEISTESSEIIQGSEAVKNEPSETEKLETETSKLAAEETEKVIESTDTEIETEEQIESQTKPSTEVTISVSDIPEYSGKPYVEINGNTPKFLEADLSTTSYEYYSDLDNLGRCGVVYACIGTDLMPTEERGNIGSVKPTGWHTIKYDVVDGKYLYNRCHLIGYQLSGENANTKNLITGTRYLNVDGMLPFENMVADYVKETNNHVMYRVTPVFEGDNLLASGVQIEAESVEDNGEGILFNVYCYNVQPNVKIDYATGDSNLVTETSDSNTDINVSNAESYTKNENVKSENNTKSGGASESSNSENSGNMNSASESNEGTISSNDQDTTGSSTLMVWKSATGNKYHSINNCGRMNPDKAVQITEEQAISQGLGKCSKCW